MFKKMIILICLLLMPQVCFAESIPDTVSSNTVSYSTVATVATFNTVVDSILIINETTTNSVYIQLSGLGWDIDGATYTMPNTATGLRVQGSGFLSLDIKTKMIGWVADAGSGTLTYMAIGQDKDLGKIPQ